MNVILIISDTFRRDCVSCYGAPSWVRNFKTGIERLHTPHLTQFAKRALIFENAYLASFPTVLARHDILTGRYTWTYKDWSPLDGEQVTLQETLNKSGIFTGLVADTPYPFAPGFNYQRGFQTWDVMRGQDDDWKGDPVDPLLPADARKLRDPETSLKQYLRNVSHRHWEEDYFPARTMREAARWLERNHKRAPFFLYVDTFDPHEPWDPPQYYADLYDPGYTGERVIHPAYGHCDYLSDAELRQCQALYSGEITLVDRWFGYLLDRIDSLGLMGNTAVIFVSDHGFYFGEHGYIGKSIITPEFQQPLALYPEVARVPLLVYLPGIVGGSRTSSLAQTVDLMPTICELLGAPVPEAVQSTSLVPILQGKGEVAREFVVCSPTISHANLRIPHPTVRSSVYTPEWLLVYGAQVDPSEADRSMFQEQTRMVDSKIRQIKTLEPGPFRPELYYLPDDSNCRTNVLQQHRPVADRLHAQYVAFLERTGVPERHLEFFRTL